MKTIKTLWNKLGGWEKTLLACIVYYAVGMLITA
jgi:hypothetical protein